MILSLFQGSRLPPFVLSWTLSLCLTASLLAGGTVKSTKEGALITVVVPSLPKPYDTSTASRAEVAVVQQFEKDFPEIFRRKYLAKYMADPEHYGFFDWNKVNVRLLPSSRLRVEGVEGDLMSIAGGNPADILYVNFSKSDNYVRNGFLYPLDKKEDQYFDQLTKEELDERIHPKLWPVIRRKGPTGKEHVWMMPIGGFLGRVLAYRKELFDEAGLEYPNADWTWDDMLAAAKKLTRPEHNQVGLLLSGSPGWNFSTFLWSAGADVMEYSDKEDEWKCIFGTREAAEALDYYLQLTQEPWKDSEGRMMRGYAFTDPRPESLQGDKRWGRGEIAMNLVYINNKFFSGLNPDLVGLTPVPIGPGGMRAAELNSEMLGLYSEIKFPAVRDAAWEYILYQNSERALAIHTKILVEGGLGRFINPRRLERFGYPEVVRLAPKGWAEVFEIASSTGRPEPYGRNSNLAYRMLGRPIDEATQLAMRDALPEDRAERLKVLEDIMVRAEAKANEVMIGKITPADRTMRDSVAWGFLACAAISFGLVFFKVFKTFDGVSEPSKGSAKSVRRGFLVVLLLLPALGSILLWKYYPLLVGSVMGFQDYRLLGDSSWVGVKHFGDVLWDDLWWQSLWNSLRFSFLMLIFGFLPPLILAILLQEVPKGKITYRLLFYLPAVLAGIITALLWKQFYDPSPNGALNALLARVPAIVFLAAAALVIWGGICLAARFRFHGQIFAFSAALLIAAVIAISLGSIAWPVIYRPGIGFSPDRLFHSLPEPIQWLRDPRYAMLACVIPGIWAGMGPGCLIYLAALKGIPDDFYEASDIDGAGFLDKIIAIILPTLRPLLIINFVGAFIASWLGSADTMLAMTAGQADTEVAPLNIFYKAFVYLQFGPATAMAWILGLILIGFTVYQLRMLSKVEFRTTGGK